MFLSGLPKFLPIFLLLIYGVIGVDMNLNKRILRRNTEIKRTYNLNHPPALESYDLNPMTVEYEDQEVPKERNHKKKSLDKSLIDNESALENSSSGKKTINTQSENNTHSHNFASAVIVNNDYDGDKTYKPKARSIKLTGARMPETDNAEFETRTKTQRRRSQVRKVKVNKSQLNAYLNKTDESKSEDQTVLSEHLVPVPKRGQTFQKRKQLRDPVVPIIESESYVFSHSGNFHYSYEGGDGTKAFERGELKSSNGGAGSAVEGNFSYKDKDGNDFSLSYTADENGYRPVGAHLPTPPPIPPAIQRALDLLATKTTPQPITERVKTL